MKVFLHWYWRKSLVYCLVAASIFACSDDEQGIDNNNENQPPTPNLDCTVVVPGVSLADDFVCAHNAIRESIPAPQPIPDPPLPGLVWNQDLADFAQSHADTCVYAHSDATERTNALGQWVGENLAANYGLSYNPYTITDLWASESVDYDYAANTCTPGEQCGHYTQIVWRETTEVGCARANCPTLVNTNFLDAEYWVCEYLPGGNYIGERPY